MFVNTCYIDPLFSTMAAESGVVVKENNSQEFLKLPLITISRLERAGSRCKEKTILIVLSTLLMSITSLSAAFFIVDTIVTSPSLDDITNELRVELRCDIL